MAEESLSGKRVAMLVEDEFEDRELTGPLEALWRRIAYGGASSNSRASSA